MKKKGSAIRQSIQAMLVVLLFLSAFVDGPLLAQTGSIDLSISSMTVSPNPVNSGSNVTFTINVSSSGNATGVTVTDVLPAGFTYVSGSPSCSNNRGTITCVVGALNGSATVTITATPTAVGTFKNVAGIAGNEYDANMANNSAVVSVTVNPGPPVAPSNLTATAVSSTQINLAWTDNSNDETGFEISYWIQGSPPIPLPILPVNTTAYQHTGRTPATTYFYVVRAVRNGVYSSDSNVASATTPCAIPATPTLQSPTTGAQGVATSPLLNWNDISGATSYEVQVSPSSTFPSPVFRAATVTVSEWTITPALNQGVIYYWRVRAINSCGSSAWSVVWNFTTCTILTAPSLVSPANGATNVATDVALDWNNVAGTGISYEVQVATNSTFANVVRCKSSLTSSIWSVFPPLIHGTLYYWRARAANACGPGTWSATRSFTTQATVLQPKALALTGGNANGVFEAGETLVVSPSWKNPTTGPISATGTASNFTGPGPAGNYTIPDTTANYGTISPGATANCQSATGNCYSLSLTAPASRPTPHWDATFRETLSNGNSKIWTLHIGASFNDVSQTSIFYPFIETIYHHGITAGCTSGNYCPTASVTRDTVPVFLLRSKDGSCYIPQACVEGQPRTFNDVPASNTYCPWIEEIARRSITAGCGGGNYCPNSVVTREQVSVFLLKTKEGGTYTPPACVAGQPRLFNDVPDTSPFCPWIEEIARRGITSGCGGGNYCPTNPVSREQMSVFLTATFQLSLYLP